LSRALFIKDGGMPKMETVGQRLQFLRTQNALTLDQLAGQSGLSKSFLWEVEHDRTGITGEKLVRVANVLGASLDFILRGQPTPQHYKPEAIEIPGELSQLAEERGLSYRQTLALLEIGSSIIARRSTKAHGRKSKEDWGKLYDGVKDFLEEK
jgi:transcriptional regulator with XRE-family HTH domain